MAKKGDYPVPKFHFQVKWGDDSRIGFTEVSGLHFESEVIEYREGNAKTYNKHKQPGLTKYSDITLKRGTFEGDVELFTQWKKTSYFQESNKTGSKFRRNILIQLLNENHEPIFTWTITNGWISKVESSDLKADANEVAIESMTIVHEGLEVKTEP
jgi:phage tail-like protein